MAEHLDRKTIAPRRRFSLAIRALLVMATAFVLMTEFGSPRMVAGASTQLQVSARVLPWLQLTAMPRISSFQVDTADLKRGYVDLPASLRVQVATNQGEELWLRVTGAGPARIGVLSATGSSQMVHLDPEPDGRQLIKDLDLRVMLAREMGPGSYPLQLQVTAADL